MADLNVTRLDGRSSSEEELRTAVSAMPFFTPRRLVIVTNPLAKAVTDVSRKRFQAMLDGLPDTTCLVMVFEDTFERRKWKSLHDNHWLHRWLGKAGQRGTYRLCQLPEVNAMPEWIRKEAVNQSGQMTLEAARSLAGMIGNDTQLATLEINKLLTYVDFKRAVEVDDVQHLTAQESQADIFKMVDEVAAGNAGAALGMLHRLLDDQEDIAIFGMIVRQFRLLLQARELLDEHRSHDIVTELGVRSFVAEKLAQQARRFTMERLLQIYHRLLEIDESMKSSSMPSDLLLDTFITELAR